MYLSSVLLLMPVMQSGGQVELLHDINGSARFDRFGASAAYLGDINGDGFGDFISGATAADPGGIPQAGSAMAFSGADGSILYQFDGTSDSDHMGVAVAGAGDVNNDGVPDILVSASGTDVGGFTDAGSAFVYSGATGALLYRFDGPASYEGMGSSLAGVGDLNGDGFDDFMIGSSGADIGGLFNVGTAYVHSGANGSLLYRFDGDPVAFYQMGVAVASAGDVDADGTPDLIVGAAEFLFGHPGTATIYSGATGLLIRRHFGSFTWGRFGISVSSAGDIDGDGFGDVIIGDTVASPVGLSEAGTAYVFSGATGSELLRFEGTEFGEHLGQTVSLADDLDGDGVLDLVVNSPQRDSQGILDAGVVSVHSGATGHVLHEIHGTDESEWNATVTACGDVDGDGLSDLILGSSNKNPGSRPGAGECRVFRLIPNLGVSQGSLSNAVGGTIDFYLDFPASAAGHDYRMMFSLLEGSVSFGVGIPLGDSGLLRDSYFGNYPFPSSTNLQGILSATGDATASLSLPAGSFSQVVGQTLWMAAIAIPSGQTAPAFSSIAVPLVFQP